MRFHHYFFLFSLLLLFSPLLVGASVDAQLTQYDDHLQISYPKNIYYPFNDTLDLSFQVFNSSGSLLSSGVDCGISFYDRNGSNIYSGVLLSDGDDWIISLGGSFSSDIGLVPYNVNCNSSLEFGFVSSSFEVTTDGKAKTSDGGALFAMIVAIPLLFGVFMLVGAATLGDDHNIFRTFLFLLSPIMIWVSFHFSMIGIVKYFGLFELQEAIAGTTYWMAWLFFVLLSYFVIYFIWKAFDEMAAKKKKKNGGMEY